MSDKTRLPPEESFPDDLHGLADGEVEKLNSRVHRQLDAEYLADGEPSPETEFRMEELETELDDRGDHPGPATSDDQAEPE